MAAKNITEVLTSLCFKIPPEEILLLCQACWDAATIISVEKFNIVQQAVPGSQEAITLTQIAENMDSVCIDDIQQDPDGILILLKMWSRQLRVLQ